MATQWTIEPHEQYYMLQSSTKHDNECTNLDTSICAPHYSVLGTLAPVQHSTQAFA